MRLYNVMAKKEKYGLGRMGAGVNSWISESEYSEHFSPLLLLLRSGICSAELQLLAWRNGE